MYQDGDNLYPGQYGSDDTAFGGEHTHGKTQYIPGKQVLVKSWRWKIYLFKIYGEGFDR